MAVYELNGGQLLRVARSIDGKLEQKYFSLIGLNKTKQREVRKQAKTLDEKWADKQGNAKDKRVREASTSNKHSTGVRGINLVFRPSPAFRVQVQSGGRSYVKEFSVRRLTVERAWESACRFLSEVRGYKSVPRAWKQRMPKVPKTAPQKKTPQKKAASKNVAATKSRTRKAVATSKKR